MLNQIFVFKTNETDKNKISKLAHEYTSSVAKKIYNLNCIPIFSYDKSGKPFFKNFPWIHFNISHSKNFIALVFSENDAGIDIEKKRDVNLKIAERFFTIQERKLVTNSDSFFYVWTRKEAILKKYGKGIKDIKKYPILKNNSIKTIQTRDFILSVCSEGPTDFELILEENFCGRP